MAAAAESGPGADFGAEAFPALGVGELALGAPDCAADGPDAVFRAAAAGAGVARAPGAAAGARGWPGTGAGYGSGAAPPSRAMPSAASEMQSATAPLDSFITSASHDIYEPDTRPVRARARSIFHVPGASPPLRRHCHPRAASHS